MATVLLLPSASEDDQPCEHSKYTGNKTLMILFAVKDLIRSQPGSGNQRPHFNGPPLRSHLPFFIVS